jgi:ubiquitin-protein ligase
MDIQRIRREVNQATVQFAFVEAHPTSNGGVYVQAALQTSAGKAYIAEIDFDDYPSRMPKVFIIRPTLQPSPHKYNTGNICYLHPNMWNPGRHDLTFVLARTAKWLNKYDVYRAYNRWPGAELLH